MLNRSSLSVLSLSAILTVTAAFAQAPAGRGPQGGPPSPPPPPTAGAKLDIADGSSASYRVKEQFVGIDFPNDAVGTTPTVAGTITITPEGAVAPGSKLTVDLRNMKSDQDMRDGYVQNRLLETSKFPYAEFVPVRVEGLPKMIPFTGQTGFKLIGNMTIHGVTKEVTFQGIATFNRDSTIAGRALTSFNFATFGFSKPTIARLMNVEDKIDLEIIFKFKRS